MPKTSLAVIPNLFLNLTNGKTLKQAQGSNFSTLYCNIAYSSLYFLLFYLLKTISSSFESIFMQSPSVNF